MTTPAGRSHCLAHLTVGECTGSTCSRWFALPQRRLRHGDYLIDDVFEDRLGQFLEQTLPGPLRRPRHDLSIAPVSLVTYDAVSVSGLIESTCRLRLAR